MDEEIAALESALSTVETEAEAALTGTEEVTITVSKRLRHNRVFAFMQDILRDWEEDQQILVAYISDGALRTVGYNLPPDDVLEICARLSTNAVKQMLGLPGQIGEDFEPGEGR